MSTADKNLSAYDKALLPDAQDYKIGIVVAEWNREITANLCRGAVEVLKENGVRDQNIITVTVPGSFELVYGCKKLQESTHQPDAVIAIGSVIQGETKHFDFICQSVSQGIKDLNIKSDIPVIFCVLTDNNKQQAIDRSGGKYGNKGAEAAVAALQMAFLKKTF